VSELHESLSGLIVQLRSAIGVAPRQDDGLSRVWLGKNIEKARKNRSAS
jgi:hypothetical protein